MVCQVFCFKILSDLRTIANSESKSIIFYAAKWHWGSYTIVTTLYFDDLEPKSIIDHCR